MTASPLVCLVGFHQVLARQDQLSLDSVKGMQG
jgi:hypothetical protein